ncbi:MAG: hypothetical protein MI867_21195 [Pseudomonadales bacterium]|nr:hypothetical protein [Pseudomonadales bacterium]
MLKSCYAKVWLCIAGLLVIYGCSTPQVVVEQAAPVKPQIALGYTPKFDDYDELETHVWTAYGEALYMCEQQHPKLSFEKEVCARKQAIEAFENASRKYRNYHRYLEDLSKVNRAGFLNEYTWKYLHKAHWFRPEGLALGKFESWLRLGLPGHEPNIEPGVYPLEQADIPTHTSALALVAVESNLNPGFPDQINHFDFKGYTHFKDRTLGQKIRYRDEDDRAMTVFIYPIPDAYKKFSITDLIKGIHSAEKSALITKAGNYYYDDFKVLQETTLAENLNQYPIRQGMYYFDAPLDRHFKAVYITLFQSQLVKIVFQQPLGQHYDSPITFRDEALAFLSWSEMESFQKTAQPALSISDEALEEWEEQRDPTSQELLLTDGTNEP